MNGENMEQLAKDLQQLLAANTNTAPVYAGQAPRDEAGVVIEPPFVVYTYDPRAPQDEAGEWTIDLFLDVWSINSFSNCYKEMLPLDNALDGQIYELESGIICADRNGLVFQRGEPDPEDERIRRMSGQYLIRFNPIIKE